MVWWLAVLAMGWLLTDGPLKDLGTSEDSVSKSLESSRTAFWDAVTLFFSWVGATVSIIGVCLVVVVLVWRRTKQWWYAVVPLIAISLQAMVFFFTTLLIDRERPDVEKLDDSPPTSSFPSGHTGAATGLYFTLGLMALRITQPGAPRRGGQRVPGDPVPRRVGSALPGHAPPQRPGGGHGQRNGRGPARLGLASSQRRP